MRAIFTIAIAAAPFGMFQCGDTGPESAADCIPTTGDNCSCEPQCMTQAQLDRIGTRCDLGCIFGDTGYSGEPNWECTVVDGACAVVE